MASPFESLRREALAVERDPALDTGAATMALLRQWLASHEAEISARKLAAPAGKGGSVWDVGYGTKQEYLEAIEACHAAGMQVYADVVFNHK